MPVFFFKSEDNRLFVLNALTMLVSEQFVHSFLLRICHPLNPGVADLTTSVRDCHCLSVLPPPCLAKIMRRNFTYTPTVHLHTVAPTTRTAHRLGVLSVIGHSRLFALFVSKIFGCHGLGLLSCLE